MIARNQGFFYSNHNTACFLQFLWQIFDIRVFRFWKTISNLIPLDFVWNVQLHHIGLKIIGLWPKTNEGKSDKITSDFRVGFVFIIIIFCTVIPLTFSFARVWGDMTLMIDNLQVTLPLLVIALKLVIMRWKRTGTFRTYWRKTLHFLDLAFPFVKLFYSIWYVILILDYNIQ